MARARVTAELAGQPTFQVTDLLCEFDYGEYEGLTSAQINAMHPGWEVYRDGCPGGETGADVYARAGRFIELAKTHEGRVLAFAHGHILRAVAAAWTGLGITTATHLALDVATISILRDGDHGQVIQQWNA